jgi:hypothetical protein
MLYVGSTSIAKAYVGSVEAQKIYVGTTEVWSNWSDAGMTKATSQTFSTTYAQMVNDWIASASYPGSVISSNGLVMAGSATVVATASITMGSGTYGAHVAVYKNGVLVEAKTGSSLTTSNSLTTAAFTVAGDDVISLWSRSTGSSKAVTSGSLTVVKQ